MHAKRAFAAALAIAAVLTAIAPAATGSEGVVTLIVRGPSCRMNFTPGWNLISLCSEQADRSVATVLAGLDYSYVNQWNMTTQSFDTYSTAAPVNPFTELEFNQSYFVYANSPGSAFMEKTPAGDMNISMVEGWNTPSYPYNFTANITAYYNESAFYFLMKWNTTTQLFDTYSAFQAENPFTQIFKSEGQMIYVYDPAGTILAYNRSALASG